MAEVMTMIILEEEIIKRIIVVDLLRDIKMRNLIPPTKKSQKEDSQEEEDLPKMTIMIIENQ